MFTKKRFFVCVFAVMVQIFLAAQTHISVPLGHPIYHVIEQAQVRGLHRFIPLVRPYTRAQVLSIVDEILNNDANLRFGGLTPAERRILLQFRQELNPGRGGLDLIRGRISTEHTWNDVYFSGELVFGFSLGFSAAAFPIARGFQGPAFDPHNLPDPDDPYFLFACANHPASGDFLWGTDSEFINFHFHGDLGENVSYGLAFVGTIVRAPRSTLGRVNTFYPGWQGNPVYDPARENRVIFTHSEPLTHFPFSHRRNWHGSVWFPHDIGAGGFEPWPYTVAIGHMMLPELAGTLLNNRVTYRIARLDREWGAMSNSASLVFNESAQSFLAAEITFEPFPWFSFSGLTGVLDYDPFMREFGGGSGLKAAAEVFQNAFSINVAQFSFRNFFRFDLGSAVIWPKRFHLGYFFPLADSFFAQLPSGDFDNAAVFLNIMGQYPGLGKLWFSLFLDEASPSDVTRDFFNMSRMMYAYQVGVTVHVPWFRRLAFNSLTVSYTRIEPYTFSHTREHIPGYGDLPMETNWVTFGRALGHHLPPNSDELLVRFTAMPVPGSMINFQYQMIRHGADYGDRAVSGSSRWSELAPHRQHLRKFFLRDGAYRWMHIFRLGGSHSFVSSNLPLSVFAEIGAVYSFFTDISGEPNSNIGPSPFRRVNTPQYPRTLSFIGALGVRIFPKW